jgi:hypothetical protein
LRPAFSLLDPMLRGLFLVRTSTVYFVIDIAEIRKVDNQNGQRAFDRQPSLKLLKTVG